MGKFSGFLIVSDMDGTFLGDKGRIVPRNLEAIEYFNKNGGLFTFLTGRNLPSIECFEGLLDIVSAPIGMHNGAYIYDAVTKKVVNSSPMPPELACEICDYLINYPEYLDFTLRGPFEYNKIKGRISKSYDATKSVYQHSREIEFDEIKDLTVDKIVLWVPVEKKDELCQKIDRQFQGRAKCTSAGAGGIEIMPADVTKASVIPKLRKMLNFEGKVFAIGDYENDIEMLSAADVGACPANAWDKVKEAATVQVCSNDEGAIADLISVIEEKYIG